MLYPPPPLLPNGLLLALEGVRGWGPEAEPGGQQELLRQEGPGHPPSRGGRRLASPGRYRPPTAARAAVGLPAVGG
eukprot:8716634-Prorocentrum_lima.AAC.1